MELWKDEVNDLDIGFPLLDSYTGECILVVKMLPKERQVGKVYGFQT